MVLMITMIRLGNGMMGIALETQKSIAPPKNYWVNTSGNDVVNHFIDSMDKDGQLTKGELEILINGGAVQKEICEELTYRELYSTIDNLWSTLFMTGYLTKRGKPDGYLYNLAVPNCEVRSILLGILSFKGGWVVRSNRESGNGFSDIMIQIDDSDTGYTEALHQEDVHRILKYGIACRR